MQVEIVSLSHWGFFAAEYDEEAWELEVQPTYRPLSYEEFACA